VFKIRMMTKAALVLAAVLMVVSPVKSTLAQEAAPAAPAPAASIPVAIGIVNVQQVVSKSTAGQSLKKQADARRKQNQADLLAEEKKLRAENDQLNAQRASLSPADFAAKQQAFQQKLNAWRQGAEQKQKAFESAYNKAQKTIFETLQKVIGEIAVQKRLTLVLNKSVVIVSAQAWDISDSALAQLNKVLPAVKM
jgi:Skp family chaperone for outer membrane proteins